MKLSGSWIIKLTDFEVDRVSLKLKSQENIPKIADFGYQGKFIGE
jgi:hypothetical protein